MRPPSPRTKWTRRVPHPVLIGHAASLTQVREAGLKRCHDLLKHVLREYEELVRKVAFSLLARLPSTVIPDFPARCH